MDVMPAPGCIRTVELQASRAVHSLPTEVRLVHKVAERAGGSAEGIEMHLSEWREWCGPCTGGGKKRICGFVKCEDQKPLPMAQQVGGRERGSAALWTTQHG